MLPLPLLLVYPSDASVVSRKSLNSGQSGTTTRQSWSTARRVQFHQAKPDKQTTEKKKRQQYSVN